jgi:hypothetical protein
MKVKLSLFAREGQWCSGGITPLILSLNESKWPVLRTDHLTPGEITHVTGCMVGWFGPQNQCGHFGKDKSLFAISGN